jgi:carbon storage regulator
MLVLSRKKSESLQIDAEIQVTVISISKGRVKLGISAPDHVRIIRHELTGCSPDASDDAPMHRLPMLSNIEE